MQFSSNMSLKLFKPTGDDRVNPHWCVASKGETKAHVSFAHSHCPADKL